MSYLISQGNLDEVNAYLDAKRSKQAQELLNRTIEPVQVKQPDALEMSEQETYCMWENCQAPAVRITPKGIGLCTIHYSQAVSSGRVNVVL